MRIEVESTKFNRLTKWHVRRVLKWFSQRDLEGLGSIRVIDDPPDDPEYTKVRPFLRGFLYNGHYSRKSMTEPAQVVLYARDVYCGIPKLLMSTPMATLKLAFTLAHEVGHHVIATRGYVYQPWEKYKPRAELYDPYKEKMADAYALEVIERMLKHWPYKFGRLMARMLSALLFEAGILNYRYGKYQSAAALGFQAAALNRENADADQCYRHAMEKLRTQNPSPLNAAEKEWLLKRYDPTPRASRKKVLLDRKGISSKKHRKRAHVAIDTSG
jgi:hypothetical protein